MVDRSQKTPPEMCHMAQRVVTSLIPECVVELLEEMEVKQHDRRWALIAR